MLFGGGALNFFVPSNKGKQLNLKINQTTELGKKSYVENSNFFLKRDKKIAIYLSVFVTFNDSTFPAKVTSQSSIKFSNDLRDFTRKTF